MVKMINCKKIDGHMYCRIEDYQESILEHATAIKELLRTSRNQIWSEEHFEAREKAAQLVRIEPRDYKMPTKDEEIHD